MKEKEGELLNYLEFSGFYDRTVLIAQLEDIDAAIKFL
jgi:hypothetical protein